MPKIALGDEGLIDHRTRSTAGAEFAISRRHSCTSIGLKSVCDHSNPQSPVRKQPRVEPDIAIETASSSLKSNRGGNVPWEIGRRYPLIPGRLSFAVHQDVEMTKQEIRTHPALYFFSSNCQNKYFPIFKDFGPVNLGVVYEFCEFLKRKLLSPELASHHLVYYAEVSRAQRTNAAFLLSAFLVLECAMTPDEATEPFSCISPSPFVPFRDAGNDKTTYALSFVSCIRALHRARSLEWYVPEAFNLEEYDALSSDPMDLNVLCPKMIGFKCPRKGKNPPKQYLKFFRQKNVQLVIRLNESAGYSSEEFLQNGVGHMDLIFPDCTAPSDSITTAFLDAIEQHTSPDGMVAVHCMAGRGRTGTLVAAWMMKNCGFSAAEAIAWLRLCRPGSVMGQQQNYLEGLEWCQWEWNRPVRVRSKQ